MVLKRILFLCVLLYSVVVFSQKKETMNATMHTTSAPMKEVAPLVGKNLLLEEPRTGEINPRRVDIDKVVPGKGFPKGQDALLQNQKSAGSMRSAVPPSLIFEASSSVVAPTDPTGAIGPNHYMSSRNFAFTIHDRNGNVLVESTSLRNIFPGEALGDPIVFYDNFAERFVITQFSDTPNGFLVAICKGPDPVNDGWYTYRFNTGSFPDYPKFSVWSDGYYVTANKDQGSQQTQEVVYVLEREKMIAGFETAQMIGFPLPSSRIGGFYSPASFNVIGKTLPPVGDARIVYFQDDAWQGVSQDILKLWTIDVNWLDPATSSITESEELTVTSFDAVFENGDGALGFGNLPQPGTGGQRMDVLAGAINYATNYRRFCDYNSVVLNFPVDIDNQSESAKVSAIRWYELRQNSDGQDWYVYQEGTYTSPGSKSAWCASMTMDIFGNIGMGYSTIGTVADGASADSFVSVRYTGRLVSDPLGTMTFAEETIALGTGINETSTNRYGDYSQITVDPRDDKTFWHIAEYFENSGDNARNVVGVFKIADNVSNDVGVVRVDAPDDDAFTTSEVVIVTLQNYGSTAQSNIPVSYSINGNPSVNEIFTGSISPGQTASFTFNTRADLTLGDRFYINAETMLSTDIQPDNDCATTEVFNLLPNDVGIVSLASPITGGGLSAEENITVVIKNFGGSPQTNIPLFYSMNDGEVIEEIFTGSIAGGETEEYTFTITTDMSEFGSYSFVLGTRLTGDQDTNNDSIDRTVLHQLCAPTSNCSQFRDGVTSFELSNVSNAAIPCTDGYGDFTNLTIRLDKSINTYVLTVQTGFAGDDKEQLSLWIDFNDDGFFEDSELLISNQVIEKPDTDQSFVIKLDNEATTLGTHLLRVRAGDTQSNDGAKLNEACGSMEYGTTHDYTVDIGENSSVSTDLIVVTQPNNQFLITMSDSNADEELRLSIFTITGKRILTDPVRRDANSGFIYLLDMSYVASGIYFVRLGSSQTGKSAKFYVD